MRRVRRTWGYNYANGPASFDFTPKDATQRARNLRLGSLEKREEVMELCSFWTTMIKRSIFIESPLIYPIVSLAAERPRDWTRLDFKHLNSRHNRPATMASQTPGILRWASSIKNSMINDPGRQFFEDQVQSQGFLFLEEYLDNIWTAAKQE
jgi:hypothetical protein